MINTKLNRYKKVWPTSYNINVYAHVNGYGSISTYPGEKEKKKTEEWCNSWSKRKVEQYNLFGVAKKKFDHIAL